ncbi:TPA: type III toxin-antitoxin system ToxN/AbiQ family toxin [Serratia marcescens]
MKFYVVSDRYITFLKTIDNKVPDNYQGTRPFIGIVISVNGVDYVAPLSSPKPHLLKIDNSKASCFKLFNRKDPSEFLGVINLNYMIPYMESEVSLLPIATLEKKYQNLIYKQYEFIKQNKVEIQHRANKLHDLVRIKKQDHFVSISCNFDALEQNLGSFTP